MIGTSYLRSILVVSLGFLAALTALAQPMIGVTKTTTVTDKSVRFELVLTNSGDEALHQVSLINDLDATFGAGNWSFKAPPALTVNPGSLALNSKFNGSNHRELLRRGSALAIGAKAQIRLEVTVDKLVDLGDGLGVHRNQVSASARSRSAVVTASDTLSDNGASSDKQAGVFKVSTSCIGLAKRMIYGGLSGGNPIVKIRYRVTNYGTETLSNIAITEDLNGVFGSGNYTHLVDPNQLNGEGTLNYNASFDGNGNTSLLSAGSSLGPGEDVTFEIWERVNVITDQGFGSGIYHNQVTVTSTDPGTNSVDDISTDGTDPDPDADGDPTNNTVVSIIDLNSNPVIGIAKSVSVDDNEVTFDFYLENLGNVTLEQVGFSDYLTSRFGAGNFTVVLGPTLIDDPGTITVNPAYDGDEDVELLDSANSTLAAGDTAQVRIVIQVGLVVNQQSLGTGNYSNQVTVNATHNAAVVSDTSDDNTDPDPDGDNNPNEAGENDATLFSLLPTALVGIAKDGSISGFTATFDIYLQNYGIDTATSLSVIDSLDDTFGAGNYSVLGPPVLIDDPGTITINAAYDGSGENDLLTSASTLAAGDTAQIRFQVLITQESDTGAGYGVYDNQAYVYATQPSSLIFADTSDSGTNPDTNGNLDPRNAGEDDPTLVYLEGNPAIGIAKRAQVLGTLVTFDFTVENLGDVTLTSITFADDLDAVFGAGNYTISASPSSISGPGTLTLFGGFSGSGGSTTVVSSGQLRPGETQVVRFVVNVDNVTDQGFGLGVYHNSVTVSATGPDSAPVSDISDDGINPDTNGNGDAGDINENDTTVVAIGDEAIVGAAKNVTVAGMHVTFDYVIENFGGSTLSNLSLPDDLDAVFGAGNYTLSGAAVLTTDPGTVTLNGSFDGSSDTDLLDGTSTLASGAVVAIQLELDVTTIADQGLGLGHFSNQVTVSATAPLGTIGTDLSDFGTDADPNGNGLPSDSGENDATTFIVTADVLGLAKTASVSGDEVTFDIYLENLGTDDTDAISVTDDLDAAFGAGNYQLITAPYLISVPRDLIINSAFDGSSDTELIASGTLQQEEVAQLRFVVQVNRLVDNGDGLGVYSNQASGDGDGYMDLSDSGTDPDPSGDNDPTGAGEDNPTAFTVQQMPVIGLAHEASVNGDEVTLNYYLESLGNVDLSNLALTHDLDAVFGTGWALTTAPSLIDDPGTITLNANFDGSGDTALISSGSLAYGETAQIQIVVTVSELADLGSGLGIYSSQPSASAESPNATAANDTSDNGSNPDPDGDGNPNEAGENDATPITIAQNPVIGLTKQVEIGENIVVVEIVAVNMGNVTLSSISVTDDLDAIFGAGNYEVSPVLVSGSPGTPAENPNYDGGSDTELLDGTGTLVPGDGMIIYFEVLLYNAVPFGQYENQASASAESPDMTITTDLSDDDINLDPDEDGNPNEAGENDPNVYNFTARPVIGLAKRAVVTGRQITFHFYVENLGATNLYDVYVRDTLEDTFGLDTYTIIQGPTQASGVNNLIFNPAYNGAAEDEDSLVIGGDLAPGEFEHFTLVVEVDPFSHDDSPDEGHYFNTASADAFSELGYSFDDSDWGTDPDPDGDGNPSGAGEDDPTEINLFARPELGVAKVAFVDGAEVTFEVNVENLGNVDFTNVLLPDDLDAVFGAGNYTIVSAPQQIAGTGSVTPNASFNGSGDTELIEPATLLQGENAIIQYTVNVTTVTDRGAGLGVYSNQILGSADGEAGTQDTDLSDAGPTPDSNGDGLANGPDEGDPTVFVIGETATIGVAKDVSISGTVVTFTFSLENLGDVALTSMSLTDNLDDVFGSGTYQIESAPNFVVDPGTLTLNGSFDGSTDTELIGSGGLGIGAVAQFEVQVRVLQRTDQGAGTGNYSNQATATASSANGQVTYDLSDAGTEPDANGNGLPSDAGENDPTDFSVGEVSAIGVAKNVQLLGTRTFSINNNGVNSTTSGQHVRFLFTIENLGNTTVSNLSLPDDLVPVFGSGNFGRINGAGFPEVRLNPGNVIADSSYNGSTNTQMLNVASTLDPGQVAEIICEFLVVNIVDVGNGVGVYSNQVTFEADDSLSNTLSDLSDNGLVPDPDNNGYAGDEGEDDPTVFTIGSYLGLAKSVALNSNQVTFDLYVENFGSGNYGQLSLTDDLGNVFGDESYTVDSVSLIDDPGTFTLNPNFDGSNDTELLDPSSTLVAGDTAQIRLVVTVLKLKNRGFGQGQYRNQATIAGAQSGGFVISDASDNGTDPDPDGDGNPNESGENDTTTFNMATDAIVGAALTASVDTNVVTLTINLEAFGSVTATQIGIDQSLDTVFGAGNYTLLGATLVDDPGTLTLDPAWDGSATTALISAGGTLAAGDTAGIEIQVQIDNVVDQGLGAGRYSMQTTVTNFDSRDILICDLSDNNTNPDPSSDNDPTGLDENDATLINVQGAALGLARRATVIGNQIIYDVIVENLGGSNLPAFSMTDSLLSVFGFGNFNVSSAPTLLHGPSTVLLNSSYDGLFSPSLINSPSSLLAGERAQIRYVVTVTNVTNQGNGFGVYITQNTLSTTDSDGNILSDTSDNGILTDPNGNGIADEAGENDQTRVLIGEEPILGAAKEATVLGNQVTLTLYLENLGNVVLSNVSLTEDLDQVFGAGNYTITTSPSFVDDPGTLTLNGAYDGSTDTELFSAGTLVAGDTASVELVVDVDNVIGTGEYSNQVVAAGEGPSSTYYADLSDDGSESDTNGDGEPGDADEDDASSFAIASLGAGVAKLATVDGDQVTFDYTIENLGNTNITNVSLVEDLDSVFGAGNYTIVSGPTLTSAPRFLQTNANFDGSLDTELVVGDIEGNGIEQVRLVVQVYPITDQGSGLGIYSNQVTLTADDGIYDLSDNGTDPDPDGNGNAGDAGEDDPTPVVIAQRTEIGVAKTAAVNGAQVTFDIYLENLGNVTLSGVDVVEDLDSLFGAGNYSINTAPSLTDDPGTLTLDPGFDGSANPSILTTGTLAPGETAALQFVVDLTLLIDNGSGLGVYSNQVTANATGPGAVATSDLSDDGTNPDPNGNSLANDSGEDDPTVFTVQAATIGDFVWNDLDGDGTQDGGEPGLSGYLVYVDFNENGSQDGNEPGDTSDGAGSYAITGLVAGTYQVRIDASTVTTGFVRTSAADPLSITIATGATATSADFGYQQQDASIGDFVWNDLNGDGVQDGGEPGLSGVTLYLDLNSNSAFDGGEPSDSSDGTGAYSIANLPLGTYSVRILTSSIPTGFVLTGGTDPTSVTIAAGEVYTDADFGFQQQDATIGDFVWNDLDGDGVQDSGEPGLPGVVVYLDLNTNTSRDLGEPFATSDGAGAYDITNLATGTYTVAIDASTLPAAAVLTGGTDPQVVVLAAGEDYNDADFGYQVQNASIGDLVWNDLDGDGVFDAGEPGLAGVTVFIDLNGDAYLTPGEPNATTDANGAYDIQSLATGTYTVRAVTTTVPAGYHLTTHIPPLVLTLGTSEDYNDADFGYVQSNGRIGDFIWNDLDGDGLQDPGEPGLPSVTLYADLNGNQTQDPGEPADTTDANGAYDLRNLAAGTYTVIVATPPVGYVLTTANQPLSLTLTAGQIDNTADFGYQRSNGTIGDLVWSDRNGNGVRDVGEPGLGGVTLELSLDTNGDGVRSADEPLLAVTNTTNGVGFYQFTGLTAGDYIVEVTDTGGVVTNYHLTGGVNPRAVTLSAGQIYTAADFGYQRADGTIGDFVFEDLDNDGTYDAGEPGIPGAALYLYEDLDRDGQVDVGEPQLDAQVTDGNGNYYFEGLVVGYYVVDIANDGVLTGYQLTNGTDPRGVSLAKGQNFAIADFGFCHPPEILEQPEDVLACAGEDVTLSIVVDAGLLPDIQWRLDGQPIPGATEPTYTILNAQSSHTGDYDCVITTGCGTQTSNTVHVQVDDIRAVFDPDVVVQGINPVTLTVIMECGTDPYVYEWKNLTANTSLGAGNPLTLPSVLQQTSLIRAYVKDHANLHANAEVTVQVLTALDDAFLDLDGDGCNLVEDVQWLAPEWQEHTLDANGDGRTDVLDFLYIRVDPTCE